MELVIKIPEEYYKALRKIPEEQSTTDMLIIRNGIPLDETEAYKLGLETAWKLARKLSNLGFNDTRKEIFGEKYGLSIDIIKDFSVDEVADERRIGMTREEASEIIIKERDSLKANPRVKVEDCLYEAFDLAIKALEQESIINKIRAEIMQLDYDIESIEYDHNDMTMTEEVHTICREEVLHIIDKYKTESEDK